MVYDKEFGLFFRVQGVEFRVQGLGFKVQGLGLRLSRSGEGLRFIYSQDRGFIQGVGFTVYSLVFGLYILGRRGQSSGSHIQGLGCRVQGLRLKVHKKVPRSLKTVKTVEKSATCHKNGQKPLRLSVQNVWHQFTQGVFQGFSSFRVLRVLRVQRFRGQCSGLKVQNSELGIEALGY